MHTRFLRTAQNDMKHSQKLTAAYLAYESEGFGFSCWTALTCNESTASGSKGAPGCCWLYCTRYCSMYLFARSVASFLWSSFKSDIIIDSNCCFRERWSWVRLKFKRSWSCRIFCSCCLWSWEILNTLSESSLNCCCCFLSCSVFESGFWITCCETWTPWYNDYENMKRAKKHHFNATWCKLECINRQIQTLIRQT